MSNITSTVENVEKTVTLLDKIASYLSYIADLATKGSAYMQAVGLTQIQAHVVIAVFGLFAFLSILKFLKIITKVLIFGLIVWVVLSLVGVL